MEPEAQDRVDLIQSDQLDLETIKLQPPRALERYAFKGQVGKGAMGEVLLAQDQHLRRKVAYKKILPQMANHKQVLYRFFAEAQITAQLDHPAIIPVYNLEVSPDGQIAYSMKLIQGKTFKELLQETREQIKAGEPDAQHNLEARLRQFLKVCDAMYFAHCKGVIHRDLKPTNIMLGAYHEVYVMDWGIARLIGGFEEQIDQDVVQVLSLESDESEMERTQLGQILGTPRYLSPEQATGKNDQLDGRSDLFTLGLILFEVVALRTALTAPTQLELLKKVLKADKNPLKPFDPRYPIAPELAAIIHKATVRKRAQRYQDVKELSDDLRRFLRGEAVLAHPDNPLRQLQRWMTRHRQKTLLVFCALMLLSLASAAGLMYQRQQGMLAAQQHEHKLASALEQVAAQSRLLDRQFFWGEMALESLGAIVTEALVHGSPSQAPLHFSLPPDAQQITRYQEPVSTNWPVFSLDPKAERARLRPDLQRLNRLHLDFSRLLLRGASEDQAIPEPEARAQLIKDQALPVRWLQVVLQNGAQMIYPGRQLGAQAQGPLALKGSRRAQTQRGLHWQEPYQDAHQDWLLPCSLNLYDYQEKFLGVASIELALSDLMRHLKLPGPWARQVYLLNQNFEVVGQRQGQQTARALAAGERVFPWPQALKQLKAQDNGYLELEHSLLIFYHLDALGWTYVVEADPELSFIDA